MAKNQLDDNLTGTHQVMGTIKYMAPEQMEGAKDIDHRADIYSLGVVFYELLTGELPLGRFAPPSKKVQIDVRLDEIVLRALEKEPNQRYQHAGDVKTEVETVVRTPGETPPRGTARTARHADTAKASESWFFRRIHSLVADLDEIDRPYARWVGFPLLGFAGFWLFASALAVMSERPPHAERFFMLGFFLLFPAFLVLHVIWFIRRAIGVKDPPRDEPWTEQQVADSLRGAARISKRRES